MSDAFALDPAAWTRLRTLLDQALQVAPAQRDAWLARLEGADALLRPRLQALLSHADDAPAAPGTAARLLQTLPAVDALAQAPPDTQAGSLVGPYRLLRHLDSGGMGSVWLAERTDLLHGRQVALKLPHGAWRRVGQAERLAREREILATLEHPHIARLYDAGVAADGQPWLALEYVDGERIDAHCRTRGLDVPQRLRLFLQAARAVAHAHALLVVHRDLKPANILVTAAGEVKLLDFGIAKLLDDGVAEETALTREAGRALTPEYASPEQILGQPLGTASDVYSLGVVLYELLTDVRPHRPGRSTRAALEESITEHDVPRPSSVAPAARRRALRGDLDTIVLRAMQRDPARRYATVAALAEDIERHLAHRPVLARPDSAAYRLGSLLRRHRLAVGAGAAVSVALVVGMVGALWQAQRAQAEQRRAEAVKDFVTGLFADVDPFSTTSRAPTVEGLLQMAEQRLRDNPPPDAATRVELLEMVGSSLVGLSLFDRAEQVLARAIAEGRQALGNDHPLTVRARITMLAVHRFRGRGEPVQAELDALLPVLRAAPDAPTENLQRALTAQAHHALGSGRAADAMAVAREALALAQSSWGPRHPATATAALLLATAAAFGADPQVALALAAEARERQLDVHGADPPHAAVLDARYTYGRALGNVGRYAEAVAEQREVLRQALAVMGEEAHLAAFVAADLARFELELGRPVAAEAAAARSLAILARQTREESYTMAAARGHHARALLALQRSEAAHAAFEQSARTMARERGSEHALTLDLVAGQAAALAQMGRTDDAWALLAPRLAALRVAPTIARHRGLLAAGTVRRLQGQADEARALLTEALEAAPEQPPHLPRRDAALAELARLDLARGDAAAALAFLRRLSRAPGAGDAQGPAEAERLETLGRAQLALGQAEAAREALAAAARLRRDVAAVFPGR